jgi:diadenosine tetraphosphate (Ap4A) HIT family hydrolase
MTDATRHDIEGCLACDLTHERQPLPGGRIHATDHWVVEHCIGPLGVGSLIVKPIRHCLHVADLTDAEAVELGSLLKQATSVVQKLAEADQVYVCLWSHAGWDPGHIHFVLQPSWNQLSEHHDKPGPFLQVDMFTESDLPPHREVEEFTERARSMMTAPNETTAATR